MRGKGTDGANRILLAMNNERKDLRRVLSRGLVKWYANAQQTVQRQIDRRFDLAFAFEFLETSSPVIFAPHRVHET